MSLGTDGVYGLRRSRVRLHSSLDLRLVDLDLWVGSSDRPTHLVASNEGVALDRAAFALLVFVFVLHLLLRFAKDRVLGDSATANDVHQAPTRQFER